MWGRLLRYRRYASTLVWLGFALPALFFYGGWAKLVVVVITVFVVWGAYRDLRRRSGG